MNKIDEDVEFARLNAKKYPEYEKEVFQAILISRMFSPKTKESQVIPEAIGEKAIKSKPKKENYKGPSGGIRLLIAESFFDTPKSSKEIETELIRQGYRYPSATISKLLSINFMKNNRILTRLKTEKKWKYVIRK